MTFDAFVNAELVKIDFRVVGADPVGPGQWEYSVRCDKGCKGPLIKAMERTGAKVR